MTINITFHLWWAIPSLVTLLAGYWVHWMTKDDNGWLAGVGLLMCATPALFVSMVAWLIGAICK